MKLKIIGMHCTSCAMMIDGDIEDTIGVTSVNTSYARSECEVEFDEQKVNVDEIIKTIKTTGYTAEIAKLQ